MSGSTAKTANFGGLEVVSFESRMAREMAGMIQKLGGVPRVAPSMREVPLEENQDAFAFADELFAGRVDAIIFMTGAGTRVLVSVLETRHPRQKVVEAFSKTTVIARGPKANKALRDLGVPVTIAVPEPNTWREILDELDENPRGFTLQGSRVAVQEYGVPNQPFLWELKQRGVEVLRVPVYRWTLPEDTAPLLDALDAILEGRARVVMFTNARQIDHVLQVATENGLHAPLLDALARCLVCSIGPTCSEVLLSRGIAADIEPEHSKMGPLVQEAARRAPELLKKKSEVANKGSEPLKTHTAEVRPYSEVVGEVGESESAASGAAAETWRDSRFMKACRREPVDATPVWLMRQAGRYMKEYRELRARVPFLELCKNPDLVAEVTVTAAEKIGADAAILFADLLLIVEPLGFGLEYDSGEGPVVTPALRETQHLSRLREVNLAESLGYVFEAVRRTRAALPAHLPLIGFAGAPFTLASYLIEGGASKNFRHTKSLMYRDPGAWRTLMEHLAHSLAGYINGQIAAGVQAVQVFDSWVGCLAPADYREYVLPYTRAFMKEITPGTPIIHFGTGTATLLEDMRAAGGDVIGLDWHVELDEAWARVGQDVGVQGNLDPLALYGELPFIRRQVERILGQAGGRPGHIFNLGHGILPETPFENVVALIEMVREISSRQRAERASQ
jgi:uroporphyrinogen decarboxylase